MRTPSHLRLLLLVLLAAACESTPPAGENDAGDPDADAGTPAGACARDEDCADALFCNGDERCDPEDGTADARGCVFGVEPCGATETCDEGARSCESGCGVEDADRDGERAPACGGFDCDDTDGLRFPGAAEVCDDVDQDCDPSTFGTVDADSDGYVASRCCNPQIDGTRLCGNDCDDGRADVSPMAVELCNMRDDDCDGAVDEDAHLQCTLFGVAVARCELGQCLVDTCETGRDDCDGVDSTGCEALLGSVEHCASCGDTCTASGGTAICSMGACAVDSCDPGLHTCEGACVEDDAVATCGSRCTPCPDPDHGDASCEGSPGAYACVIHCDPGYALDGDACDAIAAPRPLAPGSGTVLTSRRPRVHVALPAGADGFEVDLCTDRSCATIVQTFSFTGADGVLSPGGADLAEGRVYFWRARSTAGGVPGTASGPVWQLWTRREAFLRDTAIGVAPDYDGDGVTDLAIATTAGVRVSLGQASPPTADPFAAPTTLTTAASAAVHAAGDLDGDGFVDLLEARGSQCVVHRGGAGGLTELGAIAGAGACLRVAPLGDVDRDGYADVAIATTSAVDVVLGAAGMPALSATYPDDALVRGEYLPVAGGDFDGDGYGDLVRYSNDGTRSTGLVIRRGSASGLGSARVVLPAGLISSGGALLGVASAGDLNRDGLSDLLVRVRPTSLSPTTTRVVWGGGTYGIGTVAESGGVVQSFPGAGYTLTGMIDLLGDASGPDGFDDILIDQGGNLVVHRGGAISIAGSAGTLEGVMRGDGLGPVGPTSSSAMATWSGSSVAIYGTNRGALVTPPIQMLAAGATVNGIAGAQP